ncbi:MAG: hypothetical protein J6S92_01985, partial [Oscillospiraceae bacterium]|nr:hypothetical protein [Oscillospiraceae bacterium]
AGNTYATVSDITAIGRTLSTQQEQAAGVLLTQASAMLRLEANSYGKNIGRMIADPETGADFALAVKMVVVQAVCRALDAAEQGAAVQSASESLGPYQYNYTYLNAGQFLYYKKSEMQQLGVARQSVGWADLYGVMQE